MNTHSDSQRQVVLRKLKNWLLASLTCVLTVLASIMPVHAQFLPTLDASSEQVSYARSVPVFTQGNVELSPVFIDGRLVGTVSGFVDVRASALDASSSAAFTASQRALVVQSRLQRILATMSTYAKQLSKSPADLGFGRRPDASRLSRLLAAELHTFVRKKGSTYEVFVAFPRDDPPELIFTVTPADVSRIRVDSSDPDAIARRVAGKVRRDLLAAWEQRQPAALWQSARRGALGLLLILLVSCIAAWLQTRLRDAQQVMLTKMSNVSSTDSLLSAPGSQQGVEDEGQRSPRLLGLRMALSQKISLISFNLSFLFWGQALLWTAGIAWLAGLFYWSRPFSNWILGVSIRGQTPGLPPDGLEWPPLEWLLTLGKEATIGTPILVLFLVMLTRISIKAGNVLADQYVNRWALQQDDTRAKLRAPTLTRSVKAWVRVSVSLILGIAIFYQLHQLGAFTQAVTIVLGFLSFALSLASQNLLKDLIGGLMILIEDQFAVGDVVWIGDQSGLVENVGLRVTQLRNLDGELISIPNGTITTVRNLSSSWSRVNYALTVSIGADVDAVMALMESVAQDLYREPGWAERILEPPEMLGIDEIAHTGVLIRILIKTEPLQQWPVGREYRRRLKQALDAACIDVGVPRLDLVGPVLPRTPKP